MADESVSDEKNKPFDEQTLARVLEAAYVLQEHTRGLPARKESRRPLPDARQAATPGQPLNTQPNVPAKDDFTSVLARIVETQHQIQVHHLDFEPTLSLIVERVAEIAKAGGAAVGILDGKTLRYRAAAGLMTLPVGTEVPMEKALCAASLRVGDVVRCGHVSPEFLIDAAECRRRGIQSLISVPIYQDGKTAGGLEVYYARAHAFFEPDVHACQLMAGLVTEALARNEGLTWKNSIATERAVLREALEKLTPNLAALVDSTVRKQSNATGAPTKPPVALASAKRSTAATWLCHRCGHEVVGEEQFCGQCGAPRSGNYGPPNLQSKVASLFYMQEGARKQTNGSASNLSPASLEPSGNLGSEKSLDEGAEDALPELFGLPDVAMERSAAEKSTHQQSSVPHRVDDIAGESEDSLAEEIEPTAADDTPEASPAETALVKPDQSAHWSSAAAAREFLERLGGNKRSGAFPRFLSARRGDLYLAVAVILVALAIRWGIWSNPSVSVTGSAAPATHQGPDADLSAFDRLLIKLGLAEAPEAPEDKGNPNIQVWVDTHTALYYCPGSDLYGKTPTGKFATQRAAQLDQYEPANRKACN